MNNKSTRNVNGFRAYAASQYAKRTGIKLKGKDLDNFMSSNNFREIRKQYVQEYNKMGHSARRPYVEAHKKELSIRGSIPANASSQSKPKGWSVTGAIPGGAQGVRGTFGRGVIGTAIDVDMSKMAKDGTPRNTANGRIKGSIAMRTGNANLRTRPISAKDPGRVSYGRSRGQFSSGQARANYANRMNKAFEASSANNHAAMRAAQGNSYSNGMGSMAGLGYNVVQSGMINKALDLERHIEGAPYSTNRYKNDVIARVGDLYSGITGLDFQKVKQSFTGDDGSTPLGYYRKPNGQLALYKGDRRQSFKSSPFYNDRTGQLNFPKGFIAENAILDPESGRYYIRPWRREDWMDTHRLPGVPDVVGTMWHKLPMDQISNANAIKEGLKDPGNEIWRGGDLPEVEVVARRKRRPVAPTTVPVQQAPPLQAIPHPGMPNIGMPANLPSLAPAIPEEAVRYIHRNMQGLMNPEGTMDWDDIQQAQPPSAKGSYGYFFN